MFLQCLLMSFYTFSAYAPFLLDRQKLKLTISDFQVDSNYFRNLHLYNEYADSQYNVFIDNDISLNTFNG